MSAVAAEEAAAVLTEARAKKSAALVEVETLKAAFVAESTLSNFKRYYTAQAEFFRMSTRVVLLERWAADLGLGVAA